MGWGRGREQKKPSLLFPLPLLPIYFSRSLWLCAALHFKFQVTGMIEGFFGFEIFDCGIFWVGKLGKYFFVVA